MTLMHFLVLSEIVIAAMMIPWAIAYLLFPSVIYKLVAATEDPNDAFASNFKALARVFRYCAASHILMSVACMAMAVPMMVGMMGMSATTIATIVALRLIPIVQFLVAGIYSVYFVNKFRRDIGMAPFALRDLWAGIKGGI